MSSAWRACAWSACACWSAGRSRTSWIESAAAITITSSTQPSPAASSTIRPIRGSTGSCASRRPSCVSLRPVSSSAPSSCSSAMPSRTWRRSGGSRNGKSSTSPRSIAAICRITAARLVRRISGSVKRGRSSKSSSLNSRIAMPSATRPQRPLRWSAHAWRDRLDRQPLDLQPRAVAARCAPCRGRRRSGCRARSATSRRRWWRARRGGPCAASTRAAGRRWTGARTAAGSRRRCAAGPRARRRCRGSRARRRGRRGCRRAARAAAPRPRRRSRRSGRCPRRAPVADLDRDTCGRRPRRSARRRSARRSARGRSSRDVTITFRSGRRGRIRFR